VYVASLVLSYRFGDLSHVYPIARGTGPLLVALLSERVVGERLAPTEVAGTALVSLGILSLALDRSLARPDGRRAAGFALLTGIWIAGYTLVDGMGVRTNGDAGPLSYLFWLQAVEAVPFLAVTAALRWRDIPAFLQRSGARAAAGGIMATGGYSMVLWAYSLGAIAPIAALRETSVILAAVIGSTVLGEPFGRRRLAAAAVVADDWNRPYPRETAAFPAPWTRTQKFWPPVARVDNVYGDRNLVCSCVGMEAYS